VSRDRGLTPVAMVASGGGHRHVAAGLRNCAHGRARGFTLVEVMVALAVVAIALPALLVSLYQQADSTAYLRDKSLAHMVAASKLAELRILSQARESVLRGKDSGAVRMAERDWFWWLQSQPTDVDQFYRVEIDVALSEEAQEQPLYTLVAFLLADLRSEQEGGEGPGEGGSQNTGQGKGQSRGESGGAGKVQDQSPGQDRKPVPGSELI
jgi:general secretion pathway protein I